MKHLEIELKTLLKKDEYNRLKDQFTGVTPVLTNKLLHRHA